MSIYLKKYSLGYVPVPKVACTTIKTAMFRLENSFDFDDFTANGRRYYIHDFYASVEFERASRIVADATFRFCVLRDPVDRFISAYVNRVLMHNDIIAEISENDAKAQGLSREPGLSEMVTRIDDYRRFSPSIDYHFAPMTLFLGEDAEFFTRLYKFSELAVLAKDLSALSGMSLTLGHWQKSDTNKRIERGGLDASLIRQIEDLYAADYRVFGSYL